MPVFLHTQTQLSFSSEAGPGGYPDYISAVTDATDWTALIDMAGGLPAGARSVTFDTASGTIAVGNYVAIGSTASGNQEIRRIASLGSYNGTGATGTIMFDYPTGFFHANNEVIDEKTIADVGSETTLAGSSLVTFIPGVWETVDVPDPDIEMVPHWFLGTTANRNPTAIYRGRQIFEGAIPNIILLNGYPLRFPIGRVRTEVVAANYGAATSTLSGNHFKGQRVITVAAASTFANAQYVIIEATGTNPEARQIISGGGTTTLILNYPLMLDHATGVTVNQVGASPAYAHTIVEDTVLDSTTWNIRYVDTAQTVANDVLRRYVGGKIGAATISADEGGLLRMSWNRSPFLDMIHNQEFQSNYGGGTSDLPKFNRAIGWRTGAAGDTLAIWPTTLGGDRPHSAGALGNASYPTTEPYYFSQGAISYFGVTFARIRNFRLDINNNLDPRYYIRDNGSTRIPSEIQEQRREYRMSATIALPDSFSNIATTRSLFKELLLEGNYSTSPVQGAGFDITLTFTRGTNDTIVMTIPPASAATGLNSQGAFIVRAPHAIPTDSPISIPVDILFRSMQVVVTDSLAVYP